MSNTIKNNIYAAYIFTAVLASILINVLLKLDIELDYMSIDIYSIAAISNEKSITIFGYILLKTTRAAKDLAAYPYPAAIGLLLTAVTVPLTMLVRWALNKFGPKTI